jgi:formylglycine-generating enzyme required for sulfatase activity
LRGSEDKSVTAGKGKADQADIDANANGYRLPTEAQREYAARDGNPTDATNWNYTYVGNDGVDEVAVYDMDNSDDNTAPVKSKTANSLGLYDMSGNVWEWCWDIYSDDNRVLRGGSWDYDESNCTVAYRDCNGSDARDCYIGFRVACP